jgi:hypothetical protein
MREFIHELHGETIAENNCVLAGVGLLVLIGAASLGSHVYDWLAAAAATVVRMFGG